jgi:hypothetical protein
MLMPVNVLLYQIYHNDIARLILSNNSSIICTTNAVINLIDTRKTFAPSTFVKPFLCLLVLLYASVRKLSLHDFRHISTFFMDVRPLNFNEDGSNDQYQLAESVANFKWLAIFYLFSYYFAQFAFAST